VNTSNLVARAIQASYSSKDHKVVVAVDQLDAPATIVDISKSTNCRQTPQCCFRKGAKCDKHHSMAHEDGGLCAQKGDGRGEPT